MYKSYWKQRVKLHYPSVLPTATIGSICCIDTHLHLQVFPELLLYRRWCRRHEHGTVRTLCREVLEHWQWMWQRILLLELNCNRSGVCDCYTIRALLPGSIHLSGMPVPVWTNSYKKRSNFELRVPAFLANTLQEHNQEVWHSEHAETHSV